MSVIKHALDIEAPLELVYGELTTLGGLRGWWTTDTTGNPEKGGELKFGFGGGRNNLMKVTENKRNKSVSWKVISSSFPLGKQWVGTQISFGLSEAKNRGTTVTFQHAGWAKETDFYELCSTEWERALHSLKKLCENGKGEPTAAGRA